MEDVESIKPYGHDDRAKEIQVEAMFDNIAPAYDLMNRAMTGGLDRLWLRRLLREAERSAPTSIADLATGTGDVALALAHRLPRARIVGLDLSEGMLAKARAKARTRGADVEFRQADCLATGLPDSSVDMVTIAYGVRNYADISAGLREMARILRPGGRVLILELSTPTASWCRPLYSFYTKKIIPLLGRMAAGDQRAYTYLPESIAAAPQGRQLTAIMEQCGFSDTTFTPLTLGVCTLYTATK